MPWSEKVLAQVAARHHKRKGLHLGPVRRIKQMKKVLIAILSTQDVGRLPLPDIQHQLWPWQI